MTAKTADEPEAEFKNPVYVQLIGSKGESELKMFSENGFEKGSSYSTIINVNDIGDINGYKLTLGGSGNWKPENLQIKNICKIILI